MLRAIASFLLGLVVFLAVLTFLLVGTLRSHFLSEDFYTRHLDENDAYNRLYDAVLIPKTQDQLQEEGRASFVGGLRIEPGDVGSLVKGVLPPPELQRQVESAIEGAVDYLNKEEDTATGDPIEVPNVFIELRPILGTRVPPPSGVSPVEGTAKPAIFDFLKKQIENNVEILPPTPSESVLSQQLKETLDQFRDPKFPLKIPSMSQISREARVDVYQEGKELLFAGVVPQEIRDGLEEVDAEIKAELLRHDDPDKALIEALAVAIRPIAEPLINQGFDNFRDEQLDSQDRFDPILKVAENRGETKPQVLEDLDEARDWIDRGKTLGSWVALLVIAVGSIALGLVHLPSIRSALRWPGLTLFLSGAVFLGVAIVLRAELPNRLEDFVVSDKTGCATVADVESSFTPELCEIGVDVARSMASDVSGGLIIPSIVILIIGAGLIFASFVAGRVTPRQ